MFKFDKLRNLRAKTRNAQRDDDGFSFAQVIVTMVIVGILAAAIGFTMFRFISQTRETVLAANIRTAAESVQNTLAMDPDLKSATATTGVPDAALLAELGNSTGFTWAGNKFPFVAGDGVETIRIQMLVKGTAGIGANSTNAPQVSWLVDDFDAIRLQIRDEDGAWACALIVLRPDWTTGTVDQQTQTEGTLRGIWYDAGSNIPTAAPEAGGSHHCSPTTSQAVSSHIGGGRTAGTAVHDPLPVNGAAWTIPYDSTPGVTPVVDPNGTGDDIPGRLLQRTVPSFGA